MNKIELITRARKVQIKVAVIAIMSISLASCEKADLVPSEKYCEEAKLIRGTDGTVTSIQKGCAIHRIEFSPGEERITK